MAVRLVVDSSLCGVGLGLVSEGPGNFQCLQGTTLLPQQNSSANGLASALSSLLAVEHLTFPDVDEVVVSRGPGSFTGIRIGLAFIYGMAAARPSLRIGGVCGLSMVAQELSSQYGQEFQLLLPQTQTHGFYLTSNQESRSAAHLVTYMDIGKKNGTGSKLFVIASRFSDKVKENLDGAELLPVPTSLLMSLHGMSKMARISLGLTLPLPEYGRLSTAEEKAGQTST